MNKWIIKQINPEILLEAKMSYFGHIVRIQDSFEKMVMLGKIEVNRKRGRSNKRWIDSAIGMSLQKLRVLLRTGHFGHRSLVGSPGIRADSTAHNTRKTFREDQIN